MPGERILVVEDERDIAELMEYNLLKGGYAPSVCPTGEEAVEAAGRNRPAEAPPRLPGTPPPGPAS